MAIQTDYEFNGVVIPNAYIRIDRIMGGKRDGWSGVALVYKDKATADTKGSKPIDEVLLPVPPTTQEVILEDGTKVPIGSAVDTSNFSGNAYDVIYARLKAKFPDSVDV